MSKAFEATQNSRVQKPTDVSANSSAYLESRVRSQGGSLELLPGPTAQEWVVDLVRATPIASPAVPGWWPEWSGVRLQYLEEQGLSVPAIQHWATALKSDGTGKPRESSVWPPFFSRARRHLMTLTTFKLADAEARAIEQTGNQVKGSARFLSLMVDGPILIDAGVIGLAPTEKDAQMAAEAGEPMTLDFLTQPWNMAATISTQAGLSGAPLASSGAALMNLSVPELVAAFRSDLQKRASIADDGERWKPIARSVDAVARGMLFQHMMLQLHASDEVPILRKALAFLEATRGELEPQVADPLRGHCLQPSTIRLVRRLVLGKTQSALSREERHDPKGRAALALLAQLRSEAEELVGELDLDHDEPSPRLVGRCWSEPVPVNVDADKTLRDIWDCTVMPAADAHLALGLYWSRPQIAGDAPTEGSSKEDQQRYFGAMRQAGQSYLLGGELLSIDDRHKLLATSQAIRCMCRTGGWTPPQMEALIKNYRLAKKAIAWVWGEGGQKAGWWGPTDEHDEHVQIGAQALQNSVHEYAQLELLAASRPEMPGMPAYEEWQQEPFFPEMMTEADAQASGESYYTRSSTSLAGGGGPRAMQERDRSWRERTATFREENTTQAQEMRGRDDIDDHTAKGGAAAAAAAPHQNRDPPAELLDPLLGTIMHEPVRMPGAAGTLIDRASIERHLAECRASGRPCTDPFTREGLDDGQFPLDAEAARRVAEWQETAWQAMGVRATLSGLQSAAGAQLNGMPVTLLGWNSTKGRWLVRILETGKELAAKPASLRRSSC